MVINQTIRKMKNRSNNPSILRSALMLFLAGIMVFSLTSCGDDDAPSVQEPTPGSIVALAQAEPNLSVLVQALVKFPDLVALLNGQGTFTVFAPTNEAFLALLGAVGQEGLDDIPDAVIRNVLEYHVIAGTAAFSNQLSNGNVRAANDEDISVAVGQGVVLNGSVNVVTADIEASNGVVHVIDGVLVPSLEASIVGTIVAPAYFNRNFTTLVSAVVAADLLPTLLGEGPFTLFAPTNEAFAAAGITTLPDVETLTAVLTYHVLSGEVRAADLPSGSATINALGGDFYLSNNGSNGVFINGTTQVVATDIEGSNGVVHVINRTLLPPSQTIAGIVTSLANDGQFTALLAAVARIQPLLEAASNEEANLTVFAPTDAAFAAALTALGAESLDDVNDEALTAILQHHIVGARAFSTDLSSGDVPTLNGNITVNTSNLTLTSSSGNTVNLVTTSLNILATNGVIHVIDAVLVPQEILD
jgi:transforming growth factor-beta-induced protein